MPTFETTTDADWTVPDAVFGLELTLEGERGESFNNGGVVEGRLPVTPGETLLIRVSPGADENFAGDAAGDGIWIARGGESVENRLAAAGGGGADGDPDDGVINNGGEGGANVGKDGEQSSTSFDAGEGGSQTSGGAAGSADAGDGDASGGGFADYRGGGGGGGYYGGGGGADDQAFAAGGGGGSNHAEGLSQVDTNERGGSFRANGDGPRIVIEYEPVAPSLSRSNTTDTSTHLSWGISLPPEVDSVEEWQLYRDTNSGTVRGDYIEIATYPPGTTADSDTGLDMGTTYHYRVGSDVIAPSLDVDTLAPSNVTATAVDLTGDLVSLNDAPSADVRFEYITGDQTSWAETPIQTLGSPQTFSETVSGLDPETEYVGRAVGEADGARDVGGVVTWTTPAGSAIPDSVVDDFDNYTVGDTAPGPWTQVGGSSEVTDALSYSGAQSMYINGPNNTRYINTTFTGSQYSETFGFKYYETQSNARLALEFRTSGGEQLLLVGSDNPTPTIEGASGTTIGSPSPDYGEWREFSVVFDWTNETADVTWNDLTGSSNSDSATVNIKSTADNDLGEIALAFPQNDAVWGGDLSADWWADDVVIVE